MTEFTQEQLLRLQQWDTPTICNGLELINPQSRNTGFSHKPFVCLDSSLPPTIGYARTAAIRSLHPASNNDSQAMRMQYYEYIANGQNPSIVVIEDLDEQPGTGAFWGEVNTSIHFGLGVQGCLTNGSMRDLPDAAPGFQLLAGSVCPSHANVHVEDYGKSVSVHGLSVHDGDIIHMDMHGAVIVPVDAVLQLPDAIVKITRKESIIIGAAKQPGFNFEKLRAAMAQAEKTQ